LFIASFYRRVSTNLTQPGAQLETAPPSVLRRAGSVQQLISSVGRYRRDTVKRRF